MAITRFRDEYFFLSNFYPHELKFHGVSHPTNKFGGLKRP